MECSVTGGSSGRISTEGKEPTTGDSSVDIDPTSRCPRYVSLDGCR